MSRALQQNPTGGDGYVEIGDADTLAVGEVEVVNGTLATKTVPAPMGTTVVDTFSDTSATAAVWHYVIKNGANLRAGTITACWDSGMNSVVMNETSTADIGSTVGVTFQVAIVILTDMVELRITTPGAGWSVLVDRTRLYLV